MTKKKERKKEGTSITSICFPPTGLMFWERHEALMAASPPTSGGAQVLTALNRTVKEPSWYLGVFL